MRLQLPTIRDLRNPTLKQRHWEVIEEVIAFHFTPEEPMTLGKLVEIDAFQHAEDITEVSGRASSEASLEAILKKVSQNWVAELYISQNWVAKLAMI